MNIIEEYEAFLKEIGLGDYSVHSYSSDRKSATFMTIQSAAIHVWEDSHRNRRQKIYDCVPFKLFLTLTSNEMQYKHPDTKRYVDTINYYGGLAERYPPF